MDWPKLTDSAEIRLRVILLAIAVLASVLLPYKMLQSTVQGTRDNAAWVTHSAEIKGSTFELMYVLRDMESILLALYTGTSRDNAREIYTQEAQAYKLSGVLAHEVDRGSALSVADRLYREAGLLTPELGIGREVGFGRGLDWGR